MKCTCGKTKHTELTLDLYGDKKTYDACETCVAHFLQIVRSILEFKGVDKEILEREFGKVGERIHTISLENKSPKVNLTLDNPASTC